MTDSPRDPRHCTQESCGVPGAGKPIAFQPMEADGAAEPEWTKYTCEHLEGEPNLDHHFGPSISLGWCMVDVQ